MEIKKLINVILFVYFHIYVVSLSKYSFDLLSRNYTVCFWPSFKKLYCMLVNPPDGKFFLGVLWSGKQNRIHKKYYDWACIGYVIPMCECTRTNANKREDDVQLVVKLLSVLRDKFKDGFVLTLNVRLLVTKWVKMNSLLTMTA